MNRLFLFLCFCCFNGFSQDLEDAIYTATESFIANPSPNALQVLNIRETKFKHQAKTKAEHMALVFLQCHKGFYLYNQSRLKEAISTYEESFKRFETHNLSKFSDFDVVESCLIPLGVLYTKTNDYTNAENIINQYIVLAEAKQNTKQKLSGVINLAQLYFTIGRFKSAIQLTYNHLNTSNIDPEQKEKLVAINMQSKVALGHDVHFNDDGGSFQHEKEYRIALKNGDYAAAFKAFKSIHSETNNFQETKRDKAKRLLEEAQLYIVLKQYSNAVKTLDASLGALILNFKDITAVTYHDLYEENTFIDIFDMYASLEPNAELAIRYYDLSFYVSKLLRSSWTSQQSKIINQGSIKSRSEKCIALLYKIYQDTKDKSKIYKAFEYSERSKGSLVKEIFQKKLRLQQFPKDTLLLKEYELLRTQERITGALINERLNTNSVHAINELNKQLTTVSLNLKALHKYITNTYPNPLQDISLAAIQQRLTYDNAVALAYFYGKEAIYQFIIKPNDLQFNKIDITAAQEEDIRSYISFFNRTNAINDNVFRYTALAFKLYQLLGLNVVSAYQNIVLIPDGLLNFMPFETLIVKPTHTTTFANMPFLVKQHNVTYQPNAFIYIAEINVTDSKRLLGVFPVFENTSYTLDYSINEADAVIGAFPSTLLMKTEATKSNFMDEVANYGIVHLSTHATSGDFSTPAKIDFYDGTMYLNELYSMNLNSKLVVLSACETGIGRLYKGEGAMSIARGFQFAGVKNMLLSHWQVNDAATANIMAMFYGHYKTTKSASYANQQSKLSYLESESIPNIKKSPYYWGAFAYYGEIEKPNTNIEIGYFLVIGIVIIAIVVLLVFKYKRLHGKNAARFSLGKRIYED